MKDKNADAERKLRKLGERLRALLPKRDSLYGRDLETVQNAVREQYLKDIKPDPNLIAPPSADLEAEKEREQEER
jgi:hypothetical protein